MAFIDSKPIKDTSHDLKRIAKTDEHGNTYQKRMLETRKEYLVLKNFPTRDFLNKNLSQITDQITFTELEYYWITFCQLNFEESI